MRSQYKNKDLLKNKPFYSSKIKSDINLLSELPSFCKEPKELTNIELSKVLPSLPEKPKRPKRLTKRQILENILPFFDSVGIVRSEHAHQYAAETYDVEITNRISIDNSLFLAKSSINELLKDLLREKRG